MREMKRERAGILGILKIFKLVVRVIGCNTNFGSVF